MNFGAPIWFWALLTIPVLTALFVRAERYAAKFTTHFVTVARAMTDRYLAAGIGRPVQYTRIFSGFPLEPFLSATDDPEFRQRLGICPGDFVVGKIARLFKLKGHDDLFAVAPQLVKRCSQIKFLLVGDGPWRERFENRARAIGLAKHFIFPGLVLPAEVPRYVAMYPPALVWLGTAYLDQGRPRSFVAARRPAARPGTGAGCGASDRCL